jgi:hypothetical protein
MLNLLKLNLFVRGEQDVAVTNIYYVDFMYCTCCPLDMSIRNARITLTFLGISGVTRIFSGRGLLQIQFRTEGR